MGFVECCIGIVVLECLVQDASLQKFNCLQNLYGYTCFVCLQQCMRTAAQCIEAAKAVGFEIVMEYDLACASPVAGPW